PDDGLQDDPSTELRGRDRYSANGCVYGHTQQPRARAQAPDAERGWGRAPVAADYYYDTPHLLGTMRTGPDLLNIGARQPSADWLLGHLYQPRAYVADSIMPSYPYLFEAKDEAEECDKVLKLPASFAHVNQLVVAKTDELDLVEYLLSLDRTYPIEPAAELR